jgi:hypothetical protein
VGVLFRPERGKEFTGDRNRIENNRLVNNAGEGGFAVDIQGGTKSILLSGNQIIETRDIARPTAIRIGPETSDISLQSNRIEGFARELEGDPLALVNSAAK